MPASWHEILDATLCCRRSATCWINAYTADYLDDQLASTSAFDLGYTQANYYL
jgi:hypothetical protein